MEPSGGSGDKKPEQPSAPLLDLAFLQNALQGAAANAPTSAPNSATLATGAPATPSEPLIPAAGKITLPLFPAAPQDDFEKAKSDIAAWITANPTIQLVMTGLRKDEHIMDFTVGPTNAAFSVIFNENWRPLIVHTTVPELETYVTNANVFLDDRQAANNTMSVRELLSVFGQIVPLNALARSATDAAQPAVEEDEMDMDKPPVDPTLEEWDSVIIPGVRKYLQNENHALYEIDEWIWRVRNHLKRGGGEITAMDMIMTEIFSGNPPRDLYKYFRNRKRNFAFNPHYLQNQKPEDRHYLTISGTPEGAARLRKDIEALKTLNCRELGFSAVPSGRDLYHWSVKFFNFSMSTDLGQDLANHHQIHPPPARRWRPPPPEEGDKDKLPVEPEIKQTEITLEMKFLPDFPESAPLFRIISPTLHFADGTGMAAAIAHAVATAASDSMQVDSSNTVPVPVPAAAATAKPAAATVPVPGLLTPGQQRNAKKKALSVSSHLEAHEEGWNPDISIADLLVRIRNKLQSGARVDLSAEDVPLPTVGTYWRSYTCHPLFAASPEDEYGGKVILPTSALEEITQFEDQSPIFHMHDPSSRLAQRAHSTMIFEISALSGKRSFCGVLEFTGQEGTIQVPKWMMQNLGIEQGVMVQLRRVALPKGDFLQLQPDSADFLLLPDPKAALEWVLPRFVALATNDSIVVSFQDQRHIIHVLSVKPGRAISITDSDINLDFAPPRSGTVPTRTPAPAPAVAAPVKPSTATATTVPKAATPAAGTTAATAGNATGVLATTADQVEGKDFEVCDNCRRKVPIAAHTMHSLTCARMNWYCKECDAPVSKDQRQQHMDELHKLVTCECSAQMEVRYLERHKIDDCPLRIVQCMYCEMKIAFSKRAEHEGKCGDLTESCPNCKQYIQKRSRLSHLLQCTKDAAAVANAPRPFSIPKPPPRSRTPMDQDLFFCEKCGAPFPMFEDLQVHLFTIHYEEVVVPTAMEDAVPNTPAPLPTPGSTDPAPKIDTEPEQKR